MTATAPHPLHMLPGVFREEAAYLRRYHAESGAEAFEEAASLVERSLAAESDKLLRIPEAALLTGYSADTLRRAIRSGHLTNHGKRHAPRVRKGELLSAYPKKIDRPVGSKYDAVADAKFVTEFARRRSA